MTCCPTIHPAERSDVFDSLDEDERKTMASLPAGEQAGARFNTGPGTAKGRGGGNAAATPAESSMRGRTTRRPRAPRDASCRARARSLSYGHGGK